jgi:small-conductance mechanosensitive channel
MGANLRALILVALGAVLCGPAVAPVGAQEGGASGDSTREAATVVLWNRPVVQLRASLTGLSPQERARRAVLRVGALSLVDTAFRVEAVPAELGDLSGYIIKADGQIVFGLTQEDLDPESSFSLEETSARAAALLSEILKSHILETRPGELWRGAYRSAIATLIFIVLVWLLWRLRAFALARFGAVVHRRGVKLLQVDVSPFLAKAEAGVVRLLLLALFLVGGYFWLYFVLGQFYFSRPWADQLGGYLAGLATSLGLGMLKALPDLFTVAAIFVITRVLVQIMGTFFRAVEAGQLEVRWVRADSARATRKILSTIVWLFALTVAYPYIPGSESEAFKGVSVFAGLMISLGSTGLINQLVSGIVVIYSRALKAGDLVVVGETAGKVLEVGFLSTKIMSVRREEVTIPNAVMTGSAVTNYSSLAGPEGAMAATAVTIGYDAPWRQVHALLLQAAARTTGVRKQPEPFVVQRSLSDFFVEYELRFRLERADERFIVLSNLHAQIQDEFNEAGVQIMSPHFEGQPDKQIVVPKSKWFAPPASGDGTRTAAS